MILKNKVYTDIEFLDLVCNNSRTYTLFDRNVKYTIDQISTIINGTCFEVLWHYPLDEADYLNETHPDDTYVIVEALYNDVPVKRFFELPSNSAIITEALRNDLASTHFLMLGRHNCKSKMLDEAIKTRFNKAMDFTAWRDSSEYEDTDTVFADNLPPSTVVLKGEDCYSKVVLDTVKDYLNDEYGRPTRLQKIEDDNKNFANWVYYMAIARKYFGNDIRLGRFMEAEAMIKDHNERIKEIKEMIKEYEKMKIEKVIFNDPATIVFWRDGSKTVVKAKDEPFDKEKGLAMAIAKKAYGNEGNYYNEFKKFIKDDAKEEKNE